MYIVTNRHNEIIGAYTTLECAEKTIMDRYERMSVKKSTFKCLMYSWDKIDVKFYVVGMDRVKECTFFDLSDDDLDDIRTYRIYKTTA